ncbi:GbsR/MarR family transcriptional regulator [Sediminibacillus massiliensis]|uniref:GbsR/MarR family transcriptional regulator n=1 Tax=Sediminibacillus massiliensis TaxID=1926277 RepID=UPI0009883C74|nr:MarR family transcriptional regulator [Sediminibacillus massiliensis]
MSEHTLEDINELIVNEFARTIELFGLIPSEARLFAILYLEGTPMTLDEMSSALGKSKTSVSTAIRNLLDLGLVERVWKKGERKDLYSADESLYKKFMTAYIQKWIDATSRQKQSLEHINQFLYEETDKSVTDGNQVSIEELHLRVKEMIAFHTRLVEAFQKIKPESALFKENLN